MFVRLLFSVINSAPKTHGRRAPGERDLAHVQGRWGVAAGGAPYVRGGWWAVGGGTALLQALDRRKALICAGAIILSASTRILLLQTANKA